MTSARLLCGFVIAVAAGFVLSRIPTGSLLRGDVMAALSKAKPGAAADTPRQSGAHGIIHAMRSAQRDFLDVGLYFFIGVAIASIAQTQILYRPDLQNGIQALANNYWLAAPVLMAVAFVLSLCSTTDAFIIAQNAVFPATSKLAFLVFGPMLDMKLIFLYHTVLKPKVVLWLGVGLFLATYLASFAMGTVLEK